MKLKGESLFFVGIVVLTVLMVGAVLAFGQDKPKAFDKAALENGTRVLGLASSKVTLVEFGDFQCPACAKLEPSLKQLLSEEKDQIRFVFRHFPLPSHQNAMIAAEASEAAGEQGKFWEFHDLLYANQDLWARLNDPSEVFLSFAKKLDLNTDQFVQDVNSHKFKQQIEDDKSLGFNAGIEGTPTLFLNGEKINGAVSYESLKQMVAKQLGQ